MNGELRTLGRQLRQVRRIEGEMESVAPGGPHPQLTRFVSLNRLRRIADAAARSMADAIGPEAVRWYEDSSRRKVSA